jgi:N-methylhydantoinase A
MADKITEVSTKQGHDIRDCAMVAGGGCGAIHAGFIAEMLGVPIVIIPPVSALYSAFGMFAMDLGQDFARSYVARTANVDPAAMNRLYDAMETEAREGFQAIGVSDAEVKLRRTVELRYLGQFHEVEVEIEGGTVTQATIDAAVEAFSKKHEALYTFSMPWKGTEILTLRLKATTPKAPFHLPAVEIGGDDPGAALKRERRCRFGDRYIDTPVYDGAGLRADNVIQGPAIIEEPTTTVVIPENFKCTVDGFRNYVLTRRDGGEEQNDE